LSEIAEIPYVEILQTEEETALKKPLVIVGFAGAGLVGGIAVSHIIDQLKMKRSLIYDPGTCRLQ
jgi:predicted ATP-grasp superfamily ATP-dependent carboligase